MSDRTQEEVAQECDHEWHRKSDWYGDPGVVNGTMSFTFLECSECGETRDDDGSCDDIEPDAWDDYEEDGPMDLEDHLDSLLEKGS